MKEKDVKNAILQERERCIIKAQAWLMDFLCETDCEHPALESLRRAMEKPSEE